MSRKRRPRLPRQLLKLACRASALKVRRTSFGPGRVMVIETPAARRMILEIHPFN